MLVTGTTQFLVSELTLPTENVSLVLDLLVKNPQMYYVQRLITHRLFRICKVICILMQIMPFEN